ncbi:unnamed protein product [Urochloa decumbens]|uniref:F-box domain-containing protein n=1 Tax=Urochloa decumbens TaxID=240449 RepID=A0ABC8YFP2_9POAL
MERPQEAESRGREIPIEILQDILVRLPAKDVLRSSCVSKLWRCIVGDPSFRKLHGARHVAAPSESESLLVSVNREPGMRDEVSVFNLSADKAMCNVAIPSGYSLTNICNGFLCLTFHNHDQAPAVVCNPLTGETLEVPKAPPVSVSKEDGGGDIQLSHRFVLGFSPSTKEYKMFRFSFPASIYSSGHKTNYTAVYTLGSSRGWRQDRYLSRFCPRYSLPPPVHIDGNLYVPVVETRHNEYMPAVDAPSGRAARMLVLNVATEKHYMYRLPYNYDEGYHPAWKDMLANGFEMNGQMCLAVNVIYPRRKLQFWVMAPPCELEVKGCDKLYWDMRYCFDLGDDPFYFNTPRAAWLDNDQILCYRHAEFLYEHDTRGYSSSSNDCSMLFDQKVELPENPFPPRSSFSSHTWSVYGGYRPSLLSPLTFAVPPSQHEKGKKRQFEHTLLRAIRQSKNLIKGP